MTDAVLSIKDQFTKVEEPLSDVKDFVVKSGVNKYDPITFILPRTEFNEHAYPLVENENFILWEGHEYRIKGMYETIKGLTPVKFITNARHRFYDLLDVRRDTTLSNGYKSINQVLSFIFTGTRWTFSVINSFDTEEFENFGDANCLELFNKVIERYEAEFDIIGTEIRITKPQGNYIDMQFRYNHNIKTFKKNIDTNNLSTRIKGTGKLNEDGTPIVSAEYISPNAHLYRDDNGDIEYKNAPPYSNETIEHESTLLKYLQAKIQDVPDVYFELDFTVLRDAGYTKPVPEKGDVVPTILEQLNVDVDLKIMEIERYPFNKGRSPKVVLANHKKTFTNQLISYQKSLLDKIWDENSQSLRYNVYPEAVKRATEAMNNSLTQLEYPEGMGIIARDPNDPNKFVAIRSSGIGVTTNGGLTFDEAITALGINTSLLTAGQIFTNNIQIIGNSDLFYWDGNYLIAIDRDDPNKYVRLNSDGLYVAKGMITVEREDGLKTIIGGRLNVDFAIQGSNPAFKIDTEEVGRYFKTSKPANQGGGQCDRYTFKRIARYLKIEVALAREAGTITTAYASVYQSGGSVALATVSSTDDVGFESIRTLTVDLGVPNGQTYAVALMLMTNNETMPVYCRVNRIYQTDF